MTVGTIPEKIAIFYSAPEYVTLEGEDAAAADAADAGEETEEDPGEEVYPAFAVPADNEKTLKTAESWAKDRAHERFYDYEKNVWSETKEWPVQKVERDNLPFSGLRIAGLEHRGEGGRAYKVVTADKLYYDLREDVVCEVMLHHGIEKGAKLNGSFVWGRCGSQMKLVLVGSKLHQQLVDGSRLRALPEIENKALIPGCVYQNVKFQRALFIGRCRTLQLTETNRRLVGKRTKGMLFFRYYPREVFAGNEFKPEDIGRIEFKSKHNFVEKFAEVKLPDDVFEKIRKAALADLEKSLILHRHREKEEIARHGTGATRWLSSEASVYASRSDLCNLEGEGETLELPKEFQQYASKISG